MDPHTDDLAPNDEPENPVERKVLVTLSPEVVWVVDELTAPGSPIHNSPEELIEKCLKDGLNPLPHVGFWVFTRKFKQQLEDLHRRGDD